MSSAALTPPKRAATPTFQTDDGRLVKPTGRMEKELARLLPAVEGLRVQILNCFSCNSEGQGGLKNCELVNLEDVSDDSPIIPIGFGCRCIPPKIDPRPIPPGSVTIIHSDCNPDCKCSATTEDLGR